MTTPTPPSNLCLHDIVRSGTYTGEVVSISTCGHYVKVRNIGPCVEWEDFHLAKDCEVVKSSTPPPPL